ncbi:MAG: glycosyltransferase [Candidatus Magasanikbacteria bacterium]
MSFSLIIPVYNGEKYLPQTLKELEVFCRTSPNVRQIIFVNDGSTDTTKKIFEDFDSGKHKNIFSFYTCEKNSGKGYAIQYGITKVNPDVDYVVFTDVEIPYGLDCISDGLKKLEEGFHIIIGDRTQNMKSQYSPYRKFFTKIFRFFIPKKIRHIHDTQSGMKMFQKDVAEKMFSCLHTFRWVFDIEILLMATQNGYNIYELPVQLKDSEVKGKGGVSFQKHSKGILKDMCKIQWYDKKGDYCFKKK